MNETSNKMKQMRLTEMASQIPLIKWHEIIGEQTIANDIERIVFKKKKITKK